MDDQAPDSQPPPVNPPSGPPIHQRETFWAMLTHLSALTGYITFVGFFLGPVIIWVLKKDDFPGLNEHFKEAINFQISMVIYLVTAVFLAIATFGLGLVVALPAFFILGILDILFPIIAGIQANDGKSFRYPLSIRFLR